MQNREARLRRRADFQSHYEGQLAANLTGTTALATMHRTSTRASSGEPLVSSYEIFQPR